MPYHVLAASRSSILASAVAVFAVTVTSTDTARAASTSKTQAACKLQHRRVTNSFSIVRFAGQRIPTAVQKPRDIRGLPRDVPPTPMYFTVKLAGKDIRGLTYRSRSRAGEVKLYLDTNDDGLFSDETCFVGQNLYPILKYRFAPCRVTVPKLQSNCELSLFVTTHNGRFLNFFPGHFRAGTLRLGQGTYKAALVDGNFDERYDHTFRPPVENPRSAGCDFLVIDRDRDGKADWQGADRELAELMPLSRMVKVEDAVYEVHVTPDGDTLRLEKTTPQFGTLDVGGREIELLLWSDTLHQELAGKKRRWSVPVGRYAGVHLELTLRDAGGNRWTLNSHAKAGRLSDFTIRPRTTTTFRLGPPFAMRTSLTSNGKNAFIDVNLAGQAGEMYSLAAMKNGKRIPAPSFRVLDQRGSVVHSGRFEYG